MDTPIMKKGPVPPPIVIDKVLLPAPDVSRAATAGGPTGPVDAPPTFVLGPVPPSIVIDKVLLPAPDVSRAATAGGATGPSGPVDAPPTFVLGPVPPPIVIDKVLLTPPDVSQAATAGGATGPSGPTDAPPTFVLGPVPPSIVIDKVLLTPPDVSRAATAGAPQSFVRAYSSPRVTASYDWATSQTVVYDRTAAIDYARRHWNVPCNDGFVGLKGLRGKDFEKVPASTKFIHEFDANRRSRGREHAQLGGGAGRIEWEDLEDCSHFVSCCIGQPPGDTAGGIPIHYKQLGSPPNAPYGIVRVSTMLDYLLGRLGKHRSSFARVIGAEKTQDDSHINSLVAGDLIAYWSKESKVYSHLVLYLGNGKIGCHTYCRFDDPACTWDNQWDIGRRTHLWTFLHFIV